MHTEFLWVNLLEDGYVVEKDEYNISEVRKVHGAGSASFKTAEFCFCGSEPSGSDTIATAECYYFLCR
jgi:hypothetical protein